MTADQQAAEPDLPGAGPACPRCGGGPLVDTPLGSTCRSCAAVVGPAHRDVTPDPPPPLVTEGDRDTGSMINTGGEA